MDGALPPGRVQDEKESHDIDDLTGAVLGGRFELLHVIGRGGMASVWRARDIQLDRMVAVKVFPAGEASDDARRRAEASVLARLSHPSLVTLFDARFSPPGEPEPSCIIMELVDGPSLREELDRGPLPADEVASLTAELAGALASIHAAGVVHRDIKPANILLEPTGLPSPPYRGKLTDFGIAHLVGADRLTTAGVVLGTAAYLSPEQARGDAPGPPSDIYALGLVLLETLTGRRPFAGTAAEAIGARLVRDPDVPADLPASWSGLLRAMTDRDPALRPDAVEVLVQAREHAAELTGWTPAPAPDPGPTVPIEEVPTVAFPGPAPIASVEALAPGGDRDEPRRPRRGILALAVAGGAVLVAGVVVAGALMGAPDQTPTVERTPRPTSSTTAAPVAPAIVVSPTPTPTVAPEPPADSPVGDDTGAGDGGPGKGKSPKDDKPKGGNPGPGKGKGG